MPANIRWYCTQAKQVTTDLANVWYAYKIEFKVGLYLMQKLNEKEVLRILKHDKKI